MRRSKLISSTNLRRLPLSWQRCRRWQQLLICNASDAATTSPLPPPSTFLSLSIPAKQHESPKCLAHNFCVWFCFVFLIKSTRRHSSLFSSLLSSLSAFSAALFSLALPPLLARLRIRLLDIFVCCAAKCEKVAINFVSVAFNGPT